MISLDNQFFGFIGFQTQWHENSFSVTRNRVRFLKAIIYNLTSLRPKHTKPTNIAKPNAEPCAHELCWGKQYSVKLKPFSTRFWISQPLDSNQPFGFFQLSSFIWGLKVYFCLSFWTLIAVNRAINYSSIICPFRTAPWACRRGNRSKNN